MSMLLLLLSLPAFSQESPEDDWDDEFLFEDEEEVNTEDVPEERGEEGEDRFGDDEYQGLDSNQFRDDEEDAAEDSIREGQDTADIYRASLTAFSALDPEEEIIAWEDYLARYPSSVFKEAIEERMDDLIRSIYDERLDLDVGSEAQNQELDLAIPVMLDTIDPRTRARVGLDIGIPNYAGILLEGEFQLQRNLSARASYQTRYSGGNLELGVKYAPIKSLRTGSVLGILMDYHLNVNPIYSALRPQLGYGQQLPVGNGLDLQLHVGTDLQFQEGVNPHLIGGFNAFYRAAENVGVFLETSTNMKHLAHDDVGSFRFNVMTFGLRFTSESKPLNLGFAANVPYASNYWSHHYGALRTDMNYFLPSRY